MLKKRRLSYLIISASVLLLLAAAYFINARKPSESVNYTKTAMGTVVELTLMKGGQARFDEAAKAAFAEIERLEALFSSYRPDSDISRINRSAGETPVQVAPEVVEVVKAALRVSLLSGGAFDPTVGVLASVWGPSGEKGVVPSQDEIQGLLPLVDYRGVILDEAGGKVGLAKKGMALNLGGVAKGYIVDMAAGVLKAHGVKSAVVHAGGDMFVFQEDRTDPFTIGIQHPRKKGELLGEAHVYNGAVPTSGDYERYFEKDGVRYHHILDPKTGFPAKGTQSVTIIAEDPTSADALSTAVFVMGPEKGMELIERLEGVEGVFVHENGKVRTSSGFEGKIY